NTEDIVADLRDLGIGRGRRDHRGLVLLANGGRRERERAGYFAQNDLDAVLGDELGHDDRRLFRFALIVISGDLQRLAVDAAGRVDLLDRQLDAVIGRDAEGRLRARERAELADADLVGIDLWTARHRHTQHQDRESPQDRTLHASPR